MKLVGKHHSFRIMQGVHVSNQCRATDYTQHWQNESFSFPFLSGTLWLCGCIWWITQAVSFKIANGSLKSNAFAYCNSVTFGQSHGFQKSSVLKEILLNLVHEYTYQTHKYLDSDSFCHFAFAHHYDGDEIKQSKCKCRLTALIQGI